MSGINDVNDEIAQGGGGYIKLNTKGNSVEGVLLDVITRQKVFKGSVVISQQTGQPRKEWIFTLDTPEGVVKVTGHEGIQINTRKALEDAGVSKLEKGGKLKFVVTKSSVQGTASAEVDVTYTAPKLSTLPQDDEAPF